MLLEAASFIKIPSNFQVKKGKETCYIPMYHIRLYFEDGMPNTLLHACEYTAKIWYLQKVRTEIKAMPKCITVIGSYSYICQMWMAHWMFFMGCAFLIQNCMSKPSVFDQFTWGLWSYKAAWL